MLFKILLLSSIACLVIATEEQCKEQYTEWDQSTECSHICGRFGTKTTKRTCKPGCTCSGALEQEVTCPKRQCLHPSPRCDTGYRPTLNWERKRYECLSENERTAMSGVVKSN
ncbi:unnamed protein product, partial [Mesorhabditis belari]|uniref:TIL domain-containing protein n=1 Tax=Mesorhabditis belari TaxID=2138241 RepID=A0AAF3ET87_9BILA